ncbi:MAG: hypothetical protein MUF22_05505 [Chitinispirillaceae bacterium]|jgi:uncharacterized protein (DUF2147 family)|nr:hypothetical protein [Chitinispirillaceae bacterium]
MMREKSPASVSTGGNMIFIVVSTAIVLIVTGVMIYMARQQPADESVPVWPSLPAQQSLADIKPEKIVGKWQRQDGDYVLEISALLENGNVKATYFNPRPIKIATATCFADPGPRIFVKFDDKGYEGSTYTLRYDPLQDMLFGQYFLAPRGESYDVLFARIR